ncbi:hypothetical protein GCM10020331_077220 [Ectobacillus funiculus]
MQAAAPKQSALNTSTIYRIIFFAISLGHLMNDSMQAVVPAIFPIFGTVYESILYTGWLDCVRFEYDIFDYAACVWILYG